MKTALLRVTENLYQQEFLFYLEICHSFVKEEENIGVHVLKLSTSAIDM